ncbi:MAG: hypothetical protein JKY15_05895 [Deltaproteobacteria bacterium]|nr:hypothetical protein [Deltaproteobacteria bacterium]
MNFTPQEPPVLAYNVSMAETPKADLARALVQNVGDAAVDVDNQKQTVSPAVDSADFASKSPAGGGGAAVSVPASMLEENTVLAQLDRSQRSAFTELVDTMASKENQEIIGWNVPWVTNLARTLKEVNSSPPDAFIRQVHTLIQGKKFFMPREVTNLIRALERLEPNQRENLTRQIRMLAQNEEVYVSQMVEWINLVADIAPDQRNSVFEEIVQHRNVFLLDPERLTNVLKEAAVIPAGCSLFPPEEVKRLVTQIYDSKKPEEQEQLLLQLFEGQKNSNEPPSSTIKRIVERTPSVRGVGHEFMAKVLGPLLRKHQVLGGADPAQYVRLNIKADDSRKYNNTDQLAFAGWMHLMAERARELLSEPVDFNKLLRELGDLRYVQARAAGVWLPEAPFGQFKSIEPVTTYIEGSYQCFAQYLNSESLSQANSKTILAVGPSGNMIGATNISRMSATHFSRANQLNWNHSSEESTPQIRSFFEEWTKKILDPTNTDPESLISDLAHWYHTSVQGTFYKRGSSAITQAMFVALCRVKDIEPPKFIEFLDCWALSMQVEDFKNQIFTPWFKKQPVPLVLKYQGIDNAQLQQTQTAAEAPAAGGGAKASTDE